MEDDSCSGSPLSSARLASSSDLDTPPTPAQRKLRLDPHAASESVSPTTDAGQKASVAASPAPCAAATVITPDSGCLTAGEDLAQAEQALPETAEVVVPKLILPEPGDDSDELLCNVTDVVPPLDLSEVTQSDEVQAPKPLPRNVQPKAPKQKKRKRKDRKSSHTTVS